MNNILMDNVINIINESKSLVLEVKNNLIINIFNENDIKMDINIIQHNNSILKINYLSINKEDSNILINVLIKGNNNKCDIDAIIGVSAVYCNCWFLRLWKINPT